MKKKKRDDEEREENVMEPMTEIKPARACASIW